MDLTDDCLIFIFKLLDLKDQISAALVCSRFHALLSGIWRRTYSELNFRHIESLTDEEFGILTENICTTVQNVFFNHINTARFEILTSYLYVNVKILSLECSTSLCDEDVLKLINKFPNLRSCSIKPYSYCVKTTGKYMEKWEYLEELTVLSPFLKFVYLEKIFEKLTLKSINLDMFDVAWTSQRALKNFCYLERISVRSNDFDWMPKCSEFPRLRELILHPYGCRTIEINRDVIKNKHDDLTELVIHKNPVLYQYKNYSYEALKKLIIFKSNTSSYISFFTLALNLREVIIMRCHIPDTNLSTLLIHCTGIEFIDIEYCFCGFNEFHLNAYDIGQNRTTLLRINFYANRRGNKLIQINCQGNSPLLKITFNCLQKFGKENYSGVGFQFKKIA